MIIKNIISIDDYTLKKSWYDYIFIIGLFLIPFDSLPFIFKFTVYRPVSVIFFIIYYIIVKINRFRFYKIEIDFLIFIILSSFYSFCRAAFLYENDFRGVIDFIITSLLGYITFSTSYTFLLKSVECGFKIERAVIGFKKLTQKIIILPIFIGWIQLFSYTGIISSSINISVTKIFSYRFIGDRIQIVSGEPAMAARFLLVSFFLILLYRHKKSNLRFIENFLLISIITLLIFTFSLLGYLSLLLVIFLYLFSNIKKKKFVFILVVSAMVLIFSIIVIFYLLNSLEVFNYTTKRLLIFKNYFTTFSIDKIFYELIRIDGSLFLRTMNPIIGFIISYKTFFLGAGGGYYYYHYPMIIHENFPWAIKYISVERAVELEQLIGAKSFYSRIISENGLLFFMLYLRLLRKIYKKIIKFKNEIINKNKIKLIFFVMVVIVINMDSWVYTHYWMLFAFIYLISEYSTKEKELE
jgi:hypothetical protein